METVQYLESTRPEQVSYRQLFDLLRRAVAFDEIFVVSTLLRGTLQIIQPQKLSEMVLRTYEKEGQAVDTLSWQAIRTGETVTSTGDGDFATKFLTPLEFRHVAVLPLAAPLLRGFPGALHVYRTQGHTFTEDELSTLKELAGRLDELHTAARAVRRSADSAELSDESSLRLAIFAADGSQVDFQQGNVFDEPTLSRMSQMAKDRLNHAPGRDRVGDRVLIPDAHGDHLTYRAVTYNTYPALGEGRFIGFFDQPEPTELSVLKSTDVAADPELARLVPALRFMYTEFRKSPTLVDTAKTVHLSPFHFHRRFTELLGLTPKHYLLDCQIADAKKELLSGEKDLATIAADGGFAHQSHFTSRFKQATGQTPTRWRRMAQTKGA